MAEQNNSGTILFTLFLVAAGIAVITLSSGSTPATMATLAYLSKYPGTDKDAFANAVVNMASQLGISPNDIMFVMWNETEGTFSPSIKGAGSNPPVGLIQFQPDTAQGLGTTTAALAQMTATQQLAYVQKYLQNVIDQYGPLNTTLDVYLAVFYPAAIGQDYTYAFPADVVKDNPEFFPDPLSGGTVNDIINWINSTITDTTDFPNIS